MPDLGPDEVARIEALSRAIVRKLLHNPIAALKEEPGYLEATRQLFGLNDDPDAG